MSQSLELLNEIKLPTIGAFEARWLGLIVTVGKLFVPSSQKKKKSVRSSIFSQQFISGKLLLILIWTTT